MAWRCQWREHKTHLKTPAAGEIRFEDGHSRETAASKAAEILASQDICWVFLEDLDSPHPGNSLSRPKPKGSKQ